MSAKLISIPIILPSLLFHKNTGNNREGIGFILNATDMFPVHDIPCWLPEKWLIRGKNKHVGFPPGGLVLQSIAWKKSTGKRLKCRIVSNDIPQKYKFNIYKNNTLK